MLQGIVCESTSGWVLDPLVLHRIQGEENTETDGTPSVDYSIHPHLFAIEGPYRMDSKYETQTVNNTATEVKKKVWEMLEIGEWRVIL